VKPAKRTRHSLTRRASGTLNKLGQDFVTKLSASFEAKGAEIIRRVREENPKAFVQLVAGLVIDKHEPDGNARADLSLEELDRMLEALVSRK
jgi:hypothetical protein